MYSKYYNIISELDNKLLLLVKIDPLDYIDKLEDSSSSFILSDDILNMNLDEINLNEDELIDFDNSSENRDTPFLPFNEKTNTDSNQLNFKDDEESDIADLFIKN